jgi:hypothetical protein
MDEVSRAHPVHNEYGRVAWDESPEVASNQARCEIRSTANGRSDAEFDLLALEIWCLSGLRRRATSNGRDDEGKPPKRLYCSAPPDVKPLNKAATERVARRY